MPKPFQGYEQKDLAGKTASGGGSYRGKTDAGNVVLNDGPTPPSTGKMPERGHEAGDNLGMSGFGKGGGKGSKKSY